MRLKSDKRGTLTCDERSSNKIADCSPGGWGGWKVGVKTKGHPGKCLTEMIPRDVPGRKIHLETERE